MILYKTDSSIGRSILQIDSFDPTKEVDREGPDNVVEIIFNSGAKRAYFVEDSTSKFIATYKELQKHKIDLCFGWRVSIVEDVTSSEPQNESKIVIFVRNENGWKKLVQLATYAQTTGKAKEPRLDYKKLHELYDDNLQVVIPFYDSFIHKNLTTKNICIPDFRGIPLFFFEESNGLFFDELISEGIKNYDGKVIEAKSVYYRNREDAEIFQARKLMERKVHKGGTMEKPELEFFMSNEFCVESALERTFKKNEEFEALFDTPLRLFLPGIRLPEFNINKNDRESYNIPDNSTNLEILRILCRHGFKERVKNGQIDLSEKQKYVDRINYEIDVLDRTHFVDYILLVWDSVHFAKKNDLPIGRGRGSCCGALFNWLLFIDEVDPVKNSLFFERFINESRAKATPMYIDENGYPIPEEDNLEGKKGRRIVYLSSAPDIDLDCSEESRDRIVEYLKTQYPNRVNKLGTFNTYSTKVLVKDCGKIIGGFTEDQMKLISNEVPVLHGNVAEIKEAMEKSEKFREFMEKNPKVYKAARKIHGSIKSRGSHASAFVIEPEENMIPLEKIKETKEGSDVVEEEIVTAIDMATSESMVIKLDLLGLNTLSLVHKTAQAVNLDVINFDFESPEIYKYLQDLVHVYGLFQISGGTTHKALRLVKPKCKKHVVDLMALSRPGATMFTEDYANFVNGKSEVKSLHPFFDEVLKPYNNLILFQEILLICFSKLGFSLIDSENIRYCIGKKLKDKMAEWEPKIYAKAEENGIDIEAAKALWKIADASSSYSFNLCCSPDTKVITSFGEKEMQCISIGEKILAFDVNSQTDHYVEVSNIYENEVELFEVQFEDGGILKCSMDHKILCEDFVKRPLKEILEKGLKVISK